jgi:sugar phosphate isomerase/epimerase
MILLGIGDEAGAPLEAQLRATQELGWKHLEARTIEVPGHSKDNLHEVGDDAFEAACRLFADSGVQVYALGSTIMNWAKRLDSPFDLTLAEVRRAIPRMQRLGTRYVRIMSYKPGDDDFKIPTEVFRRVNDVTQRFLDAGLQPVHENCMNYGGMSWQHALELLDRCPGLQWVFDTGNPVFNPDRSRARPWPRQDPWEFWTHLRDHVAHLHIKDAAWNPARNDADYTWPGEGQGKVREILRDALARGYAGGISIEPHLAAVFHAAAAQTATPEAQFRSFVEYGRRLEMLLAEVKA